MSEELSGGNQTTAESTSATEANHSEAVAESSNNAPDTSVFDSFNDDLYPVEEEREEAAEEQAEEIEAVVEGTEEPAEETEAEETEPEQEAEAETEATETAKPFELSVNYLGQIYNLPETEARKYAQIGMNAGRLQERYQALKPLEPLKEMIEVRALFSGKTTNEVIRELGDMRELKASEVAALVEQGHDEAIAEELFDSRMSEARQKAELNKAKKPSQRGLTAYQTEQVAKFAQFRPAVHQDIAAGGKMPDDVLKEWRTGTDLTTAWLNHEVKEAGAKNAQLAKENKELSKKLKEAENNLKKLQKNAENQKKAPTSKKGTGGGTGSGIDIFAGWNKY